VAYEKMQKHSIIVMPVLDKSEKIAGVIHLHDLMKRGIMI
jgi:CBS-domain-containing membrane protein